MAWSWRPSSVTSSHRGSAPAAAGGAQVPAFVSQPCVQNCPRRAFCSQVLGYRPHPLQWDPPVSAFGFTYARHWAPVCRLPSCRGGG